jgi:hypothetical protein
MVNNNTGVQKNVWLTEDEFSFLIELEKQGLTFSRYIRYEIKEIQKLDTHSRQQLISKVRTSHDKVLQYADSEQPTKLDRQRAGLRV